MSTLFISHASEDKTDFVRPLAHRLKSHGLKVWYDEFTLRPGDSLRRSIDKGLAECSVGVIVLSRAFFRKQWPQRELDALFATEIAGRTRLIPIWHQIDFSAVASASPLMADRVALNSAVGVEEIALKLAEQFPSYTNCSGVDLAEQIEQFQSASTYGLEALGTGCKHRFLSLQALNEEYTELLDKTFSAFSGKDEEDAEKIEEAEQFMEVAKKRLIRKFGIPDNTYLQFDQPAREEDMAWQLQQLEKWVSGTLSSTESRDLLFDLDEHLDLDCLYVFFGVPNFLVSIRQRELLYEAVIAVGSWLEEESGAINLVCSALRKLEV